MLHGLKYDDDEVKLKIFVKKSYTHFYLKLKYKMKMYIQKKFFFDFEDIF